MKIAIFVDSLSIGGAQKHVRQLACGLAKRGHQITVYCLNDAAHPIYREALAKGGVRLQVVGKMKVATGWGLMEVAGALRREGCDVVVTVLFVSTIFGRVVARLLRRTPVVSCLQARNINYSGTQRFLLRATSRYTRVTVSNSRSAIAWAVKHEGVDERRCEFVANALDPVESTTPEENKASTWTALGFPQLEGKMVIGSLGRLDRQKGYDVLLEAFVPIARARTDCDLMLIGNGPERTALGGQASRLGLEGRIWFAGERPEPRRLLERLDLYVQPSRFEGTPNAVMEAMAAGVPVVASAVDGISDLMNAGAHGWLVLPDDPAALAEALTEACGDSMRRSEIALRAQRYVTQTFDAVTLCEEYERIFRGLLKICD